MFKSTFQNSYQNPFPTEGADTEDWWLSGGISAGDCVAAYQAKGAASLAASYSNLNNPGTNDAALGVAPTWDAVNGWMATFSSWLDTGIIQTSSAWSFIGRFSNISFGAIFGWTNGPSMFINPTSGSTHRYRNASTASLSNTGAISNGVMAMAGQSAYLDGAFDGIISQVAFTALSMYLLARNNGGSPSSGIVGNIQAISVYSVTLSAPQVLSVTNAMNLL